MAMSTAPELDWFLDDLLARSPGIQKALVLSRDGLCVGASATVSREDAERLAAMAAAFHSLARGAAQELGGHEVRQVLVEMDSAFLFTIAAGEGSCLAVVTAATVDVGLIAYEMAMLVRKAGSHLIQSRRPVPGGGEVT
jgi:predicted regulator of Ras-like GTPase activity (Roadblock/LC7/MglB family)